MPDFMLICRRGKIRPQPKMLERGVTTLGRDPRNTLVLEDDERIVSGFHARITCLGDACTLEDLRSTNGTCVNGKRLEQDEKHDLQHNDAITIGPYEFLYIRGIEHSQPELPPPRREAIRARKPERSQPRPINGRSSYWRFLPSFYEQDDVDGVLGALLSIFETILAPLDRTIGNLRHYFDPRLAPEALLPWLATWVDLVLNENWPIERRRALIAMAAELYRWRGTRYGLSSYIRAYTGVEPTIVEHGQEQPDGGAPLPAHAFRVIVEVDDRRVTEELLRSIIEAEKPAHTGYDLVLRSRVTA